MKRAIAGLGLCLCLLAYSPSGVAQDAKATAHVLMAPAEMKWGPAPPALPPGAMFTVIAGDPGQPGPFALRLKCPAGYKIPPHWHPTNENVTVISGTFALGMGDKFDPAGMRSLLAGGYALMPAEMHHYALCKTPAIVQVHGIGPFALNYVNPADDPRQGAPAK